MCIETRPGSLDGQCCSCGASAIGKKTLFVIRAIFIPKTPVDDIGLIIMPRMMCAPCTEGRHLQFVHRNDTLESRKCYFGCMHFVQHTLYRAARSLSVSDFVTIEAYVDAVFECGKIQGRMVRERFGKKELYPDGKFCWSCKTKAKKLFRCSGCTITRYCSVECQRLDWKHHKDGVCKSLAQRWVYSVVPKSEWIILKK